MAKVLMTMLILVAAASAIAPPAGSVPEFKKPVQLLFAIEAAAAAAVSPQGAQAAAADEWLYAPLLTNLESKMRGVRGTRSGWWSNAPKVLRAVPKLDRRFELSVVALPAGIRTPPAIYPSGSVILCQPLFGELECRRVGVEDGGDVFELQVTLEHFSGCFADTKLTEILKIGNAL